MKKTTGRLTAALLALLLVLSLFPTAAFAEWDPAGLSSDLTDRLAGLGEFTPPSAPDWASGSEDPSPDGVTPDSEITEGDAGADESQVPGLPKNVAKEEEMPEEEPAFDADVLDGITLALTPGHSTETGDPYVNMSLQNGRDVDVTMALYLWQDDYAVSDDGDPEEATRHPDREVMLRDLVEESGILYLNGLQMFLTEETDEDGRLTARALRFTAKANHEYSLDIIFSPTEDRNAFTVVEGAVLLQEDGPVFIPGAVSVELDGWLIEKNEAEEKPEAEEASEAPSAPEGLTLSLSAGLNIDALVPYAHADLTNATDHDTEIRFYLWQADSDLSDEEVPSPATRIPNTDAVLRDLDESGILYLNNAQLALVGEEDEAGRPSARYLRFFAEPDREYSLDLIFEPSADTADAVIVEAVSMENNAPTPLGDSVLVDLQLPMNGIKRVNLLGADSLPAEEEQIEITYVGMWLQGEKCPIDPAPQVKDGDAMTFTMSWLLPNNTEFVAHHEIPLDLENIKLTSDSGELRYNGNRIGKYTIDGDSGSFIVDFYEEAVRKESNIQGGLYLSGVVSISADKSRPDETPVELRFGDLIQPAVYANPGTVNLSKKGSRIGTDREHGDAPYIDYTVTLSFTEIMTNVTLTDELDPSGALILRPELVPVTVEPSDGVQIGYLTRTASDAAPEASPDPSEEPAAAQEPAGTALPDGDGTGGFVIRLPDSKNKSEEHTYTITYRAYLTGELTGEEAISSLNNTIRINYTDDQGKPQEKDASNTTTVSRPSLKKSGDFISSQSKDGSPYRTTSGYQSQQLTIYPVLYTLTLQPGDLGGLIDSSPDAELDLSDTITDQWLTDSDTMIQWMFYNPGGPNAVPIYYLANEDLIHAFDNFKDQDGNPLSSGSLYVGGKSVTEEYLIQAAKNTQALFHMGANPASPPDPDKKLTFSAFEKQSNGTYSLNYLVFVPSASAPDIIKNTIGGEILGHEVEDSTELDVPSPPRPIAVKGADVGMPQNAEYSNSSASSISDSERYAYSKTLPEGTTYSSVDYAVIFNPDSLRYIYTEGDSSTPPKRTNQQIPTWQTDTAKISSVTIEDNLGGGYIIGGGEIRTANGSGGLSFPSSLLSSASSTALDFRDSLVIEVHQGKSDFDKPYQYNYNNGWEALVEAENALLAYMATYGYIGGSENTPEFDQDTLLSLYNAYNGALSAYRSQSSFVGELRGVDITAAGINVKQDGQLLSVTVPFSGNISLKRYAYTPVNTVQSSGSQSLSNFTNFVGSQFYFVVRYKATLNTPISATNTSGFYHNGSKVTFNNGSDSSSTPYEPAHVNTTFSVSEPTPQSSTGSISVTKSSPANVIAADGTTLAFDELDDESGTTTAIGWRLLARLSNFADEDLGNEIVLRDSLSEGLIYNGQEKFYAYIGTSSKAVKDLDFSLYTVAIDGQELTITIPYTEALRSVMESNQFLGFYFQTRIDPSLFNDNVGSKTVRNAVTATYGEKTVSSSTSKTIHYPSVITKDAMDASFQQITGEPAILEGESVYGYYQVSLNPYGGDLDPESDTLILQDTLGDKMTLDIDGVRAKNSDTGDQLDVQVDVKGQTVTFTAPDQTPVTIQYRARIDANLTVSDLSQFDPSWVTAEHSGNSIELVVNGATSNPGDSVSFADFTPDVTVWAEMENASIVLFKYYTENGEEMPLPNARFSLASVYDNQGNTYDGHKGDEVYEDYSSITTDQNGEYEFINIPLDRLYVLEETAAPEGYQLADPVYFLITGFNNLTLDDIPESIKTRKDIQVLTTGSTIRLEDQLHAEGSVQLEATKQLTGRKLQDGEFSFVLKDAAGKVLQTKQNAEDGSITFDEIDYTQDDLGSSPFYYKISELVPPEAERLPGVSYLENEQTVIVTLRDDGKGKIESVVTYLSGNPVTFTNRYTASGAVSLGAAKVLTGRSLQDGEFSFVLKDADGIVLQTKQNAEDGSIRFDEIRYTQEDMNLSSESTVLTYTVAEVIPADDARLPGVSYDETEYKVTVTLVDDGAGKITATADPEMTEIVFQNRYEASGSLELKATKQLTGREMKPLEDGEFIFTLTSSGGDALQAGNTKDGEVVFDVITYTQDDLPKSPLSYTVSEEIPDDAAKVPGVSYDDTEYTVIVTLADDGEGNISATPVYQNGSEEVSAITFTNAYKAASIIVQFEGEKKLSGIDSSDVEFTFALTETTAGASYSDTAAVTGAGTFAFREITYDSVGKHTYEITETAGNARGYIYDTNCYTVTVDVTDDGTGKLQAAIDGLDDGQLASFTNVYSVGTVTITKAVTVNGSSTTGTEADGDYIFELVQPDGTVLDTVTVTVTNGRAASAILEEVPTGSYTLREKTPTNGSFLVTEDGLNITVEGKADTPADFTNNLSLVKIQKLNGIDKYLKGAKLQLLDSTGKVVEAWTSATEDHIITGLLPGTYTLHELAAPFGYLLTDDITITVDKSGKVSSPAMNGEVIEMIDQHITVTPKTGDDTASTELWFVTALSSGGLLAIAWYALSRSGKKKRTR